MANSDSLDATVVNVVDNNAETVLAFEMQSQEFQRVQNEFEEYMERLKEDIDVRAEKFGHVEYYDAKLRDGYSNEVAVAAGEVRDLEERRKALANVNPLFAKTSDLPPVPNIEDITFEHISLNLPIIAKNALAELSEVDQQISDAETDAMLNASVSNQASQPVVSEGADVQTETAIEPAAPVAPVVAEADNSIYDLILRDAGSAKLQVIKIIKDAAGVSLGEAKGIVDAAPVIVLEGVSLAEAESLKACFEEAGAVAEIKVSNRGY